jgi:hypothetical protein
MATIQYNRIIRKIVVGFGDLFNNITLVRYDSNQNEKERFLIPIAYASKERYVMRLEDDPNLDKKVQMALPRLSFEMTGLSYDSSRKQNTNTKNFASSGSGTISQYNPVPYNFDFSLYLYVRNIEDATQVIEHIVPYFTPDYTVKINMIPEMGIVKEVPVILNSTDHEIVYEGDREQATRMIIWTLRFTVKGFIFGKQSTTNLITHSISSIYNLNSTNDVISFTMNAATGDGYYGIGDTVYQGYSFGTATATAKVVQWVPSLNILRLTDIKGDFNSTSPIISVQTNASYTYTSYSPTDGKYVQVDVSPATFDLNTYTMDSNAGDITMDLDSDRYPTSIREYN